MKVKDELKDKIVAGTIIKYVSNMALGNGGGSKTFAQGGGTLNSKKDDIIDYIKEKTIKG